MAGSDVNTTQPRTDLPVPAMDWPEGDLPEQFGGEYTTLMPGVDLFKLPLELPQLWDTQTMTDGNPHSPTYQQQVTRFRLKFDRDHPLVVVGGPRDGETMTATITTNPRPRGKKDDPDTKWVSDLAYLYALSLQGKDRPASQEALKTAINKYAGKIVRLEHGLSGQCREDKVRYVLSADGQSTTKDPAGSMGCGERFYTKDFKIKGEGGQPDTYSDQVACDCGAVVRGFPSIERFLAPTPGK